MVNVHDTYSNARREPMEVLSMLAGRSSFVTPAAGGSRGAMTPADIAHALATAEDPLGKHVAMCVACRAIHQWRAIQETAVPLLCEKVAAGQRGRQAKEGMRRARVRLVLLDVLVDMVFPERRRHMTRSAGAVRMRRGDYAASYRIIRAELESRAHTAARDACDFLFRP